MALRSNLPEFGNWESQENVPYTDYFEKARKGSSSKKMTNPNDPPKSPELFPNKPAQAPSQTSSKPQEPVGRMAAKPVHQHMSKEDGRRRQLTASPARPELSSPRAGGESEKGYGEGGSYGESHKRPEKTGARSVSPLHPYYQAKLAGKGSGSPFPSWEGRASSESSHGTPGRSRMKPSTRDDEDPDRGAAVPKFGEWDEGDPAAADGYTHIFGRLREEKQTGEVTAASEAPKSHYSYGQKQKQRDKVKGCCFSWGWR